MKFVEPGSETVEILVRSGDTVISVEGKKGEVKRQITLSIHQVKLITKYLWDIYGVSIMVEKERESDY